MAMTTRSPIPSHDRSTKRRSTLIFSPQRTSESVVLTSDFDDLDRLRAHFPTVRVLEV